MYDLCEIWAFEDLANAVIIKAARDYKKTLRRLRQEPNNIDLLYKRERLEKFFHSEWFYILSNVDGDMLIQKLQGGVRLENKNNR